MEPDDRIPSGDTCGGDTLAPDTEPTHRFTLTGLGGAGARLLWATLTALHRSGLVEVGSQNGAALRCGDDTAVAAGLFETDQRILDEIHRHVDDDRLATYLSQHTIAPFQGSGGNPDRVDAWLEEHPELRSWVRDHLTSTADLRSDHAIVCCSLMGGTGSGAVDHVCDVFADEKRSASDTHQQHVSVLAVAPAFRQGDRPSRPLPGAEGEAKTAYVDNVVPRMEALTTRVQRKTVDNVILVSNDLLKLQSYATATDLPIRDLRGLVEPLRTDLDWSPIRRLHRTEDWIQRASRTEANRSLVRALLPLLLGTLQPPRLSMQHGFGWGELDAVGFGRSLPDGVVTPGYCLLQDPAAVRRRFPEQLQSEEQVTYRTVVRGAATYAAWTSAAAFEQQSVRRALVFAYGRDGIGQSVCKELDGVVSGEFDIDPHDVQSVTIDAERTGWFPADETPEVAVWVYPVFGDALTPYAQHLTAEERTYLVTEYGIDLEP
jgi:hypothetical protein